MWTDPPICVESTPRKRSCESGNRGLPGRFSGDGRLTLKNVKETDRPRRGGGGTSAWEPVAQVYRQCASIRDDPEERNHLPRSLTGALARNLGRVFASYVDAEDDFIEHALEVMSQADSLSGPRAERFRQLYYDRRFDRFAEYTVAAHERRRRAKPFEAVVETARRIRDLSKFRDALIDLPSACILGGSTSYGRFFNTIGAKDGNPSDLDLLLVVKRYDDLPKVVDRLAAIDGVGDTRPMADRVGHLARACRSVPDGGRCIFSHRIPMWDTTGGDRGLRGTQVPSRYLASLHVFSTTDLDFMMLRDVDRIDDATARTLWDYRQDDPGRNDTQRAFAGLQTSVERKRDEVPGGFVSQSRVHHVEDERFSPGRHQNIILPAYENGWEQDDDPELGLRMRLDEFRGKIVDRLGLERRLRPFEHQAISLSHTRSAFFAPHIERGVDSHD